MAYLVERLKKGLAHARRRGGAHQLNDAATKAGQAASSRATAITNSIVNTASNRIVPRTHLWLAETAAESLRERKIALPPALTSFADRPLCEVAVRTSARKASCLCDRTPGSELYLFCSVHKQPTISISRI